MRRAVALGLALFVVLVLTPAHAQTSVHSIVAFGDSITWGAHATANTTPNYSDVLPSSDHAPANYDNTYPGVFQRFLAEPVLNYGYPGETTQTGLPRLKSVLSEVQPSEVILMEGTNDMIGGRSLTDALTDLQTEIRTIQAANVMLILLTTPPTCYPSDSPYVARNDLIQQYDAGVRNLARQDGVELVDIDAVFQSSGQCAPLMVRTDGSNDYLHPNDDGNRLIAQAVNGAFEPTAARVSRLSVQQRVGRLIVRWRMAPSADVAGFDVFAGGHRLNTRLIRAHGAPGYQYATHWAPGPYRLVIVLRDGRTVSYDA